ncbi:hypothetical protein ICN84_01505 [Akkermansia glycaniphila]|uniref:hypothetical protein n=1 Tax=Akkermansia glycaniphila TaxID=1679444 RepID=UPI001C02DDEF|nr:hypothetical protein [Akkermansia glycaniphila]MBT9448746.1 hypothetical protein [Akkermansia glycaniphila]
MTEELPNTQEDKWDALQNLVLRLSRPARRVMLAALKNYIFSQENGRILSGTEDFHLCGSYAEEYGKLFDVEPQEAVRQIRQGCADVLDSLLVYAAPGKPEREVRGRIVSECAFAGSGAGWMFSFHLAPTIARTARPLAAALSVEERNQQS